MRRPTTVASAAEEERAGHVLASWAAREAVMRDEAGTDWPTHLQYAGAGMLAVLRDGQEVVWPAELTGGVRP